ncbi:hypothetical protein ACS0TY_028087 [Phlomoides rotata]
MMLRSIMNRTVVIVVLAIGILWLNQDRVVSGIWMVHTLTCMSLPEKGRYMNRKGIVTINVLGVCDMNMKFVNVLTGWEGSAADSRVLRDAINRTHGLKVPKGFQRELEKGIRKLLPGTDLVANPHINSKIHVWKKKYGSLGDLLSKSGIGWNSITQTIDVIDETADPGVKIMCHKSFPYYEHWMNIFGKDRATGENVVDPIDMVNSFFNNAPEEEGDNVTNCDEKFATPTIDGVGDQSVCKPSGSNINNVLGKKRKGIPNEICVLVDSLGDFMKSTDESFKSLADRVGPEQDKKVPHTNLNDIMNRIPNLSLQDKLKGSDELIRNKDRLEFFLTLPQDEQAKYVCMLLDAKLGPLT